MAADSVEREILIEASPEVVWSVITEPARSAAGSATRPRLRRARVERERLPGGPGGAAETKKWR